MQTKFIRKNIIILSLILLVVILTFGLFYTFRSYIEYSINDFTNDLDNLNQEYSYHDIGEGALSIYSPITPVFVKVQEENILIFEFSHEKKLNNHK